MISGFRALGSRDLGFRDLGLRGLEAQDMVFWGVPYSLLRDSKGSHNNRDNKINRKPRGRRVVYGVVREPTQQRLQKSRVEALALQGSSLRLHVWVAPTKPATQTIFPT